MLVFSVSFQKTLTETRQSKKETTKIQRCSEPRVQQMSTVDQTATIPRTRESSLDPGVQHTATRKTCALVKKLTPTCYVRCTQARHEKQRSTKTKEKHGQREILESRHIRQVPTKRRVEVQSQDRDLLIRDVCTCLAHWEVRAAQNKAIEAQFQMGQAMEKIDLENSWKRTWSQPVNEDRSEETFAGRRGAEACSCRLARRYPPATSPCSGGSCGISRKPTSLPTDPPCSQVPCCYG